MDTGVPGELSVTDLDAFIRRFAEYLNDERLREKILFFQGGKGSLTVSDFKEPVFPKKLSFS